MRLQVFLSRSGACSRRKALEYIKASRVSVGGKIIQEPSYEVLPACNTVELCGKKIVLREKIYVLLNKPKGVVSTTSDKFALKKVIDLLPQELRHLRPVGRLDKDTTGLILLTNDGDLAYRISHPSFEIDKVYRAQLNKQISFKDRDKFQKGIVLEGKRTAPAIIKVISNLEYEVVLHEGRKRQIREMFKVLGYYVKSLSRVRQGSLSLGGLRSGEWRFLKKEEIVNLFKELKLSH